MRMIFACLALLCVVNCGGQVPPGGPTMSTPMFIREPTAFAESINSLSGTVTLVPTVAEATMIEELRYYVSPNNTLEGIILIGITDGVSNGLFPTETVAASGVGEAAGGVITLNVTLPVGWSMTINTTVIQAAPGDATVIVTALGGILR